MSTYVIRLTDEEQGYSDESAYGSFRSREAAEEFADRVRRRIQDDDNVRVHVSLVHPPTISAVRAEGWLDHPDER